MIDMVRYGKVQVSRVTLRLVLHKVQGMIDTLSLLARNQPVGETDVRTTWMRGNEATATEFDLGVVEWTRDHSYDSRWVVMMIPS